MSIDTVNDLPPRVQYTATAGQDEFPYTFPIFQDADLVVDVDGVVQVIVTDYTVSGATDDTGGFVTFTTPLTGGEIVTIYRETVIERTSDFPQNGPWFSSAVNDELDRLTIIAQEQRAALQRAIRFPMSAPQGSSDLELSPIANWFERFLYINGSGDLEPAAGVSAVPVTQSLIGTLLYPVTDAETASLITIVSQQYPPYHVFRYMTSAQIEAVQERTLAEDVTTVLQNWLDLCFSAQSDAELPAGDYRTSSELLVNLPGNRTTQSFRLRGAGEFGTRIVRVGSQTSMLKFNGGGGPSEAQLSLSGFAVLGDLVGASPILLDCDAITIRDCAIWSVSGVRTQYCRVNLLLDGALIGYVLNSNLSDGRVGIRTTNSGGLSDCNTITLAGCTRINNNREHGIDIGYASMLYATAGVNVERNGVAAATVTISNASPGVVTHTAHLLLVNMPVKLTTTGALPTGLTAGTTYYVKTVLTADTYTLSATPGGVAINTSSAGSGAHTCTPQTHGVIIRDTCDNLVGVAAVHLQGLWIEANVGGWGIYNEGLSEGAVTIEKCEILQANAIKSAGGRSIAIRDMAHSANSEYDIVSEFGEIRNVALSAITDGITYPDFVNVRTGATTHANGRVSSYTGTLTECTTSPTAPIRSIQKGKTVELYLEQALTATSANTNLPTITGMPANIRPSASKSGIGVNTDASADKMSQITVLSTGVIQLANAFSSTFTAAGTKGSQFFRLRYEIA